MRGDRMTRLDDLDRALREIGSALTHKVEAYLIGGCAMMMYRTKTATKDIDLVLLSDLDAKAVVSALSRNGFSAVKAMDGTYVHLGTTVMMEKDGGLHIDIFVDTVCKKLRISEGMISRSTPHATYERLSVGLISAEDIFLFKSMTERAGDLGDMALLAERGLDWRVILDECTRQSRDTSILEGFLAVRLQELEDEYGTASPIRRALEIAAEEKMARRFDREGE